MDEIILALMELLKNDLPDLSYINEDFGQLENPEEDGYPITFPAVLIENSDTDWSDVATGIQTGTAFVTLKLVIDCYDDTHYGSGTEYKIKERYQYNNKIYKSLQNVHLTNNMDELIRIKSRNYTINNGIKVYETIFRFDYRDESAL